MTTVTSEKGLESLIMRALTGVDGLTPPPADRVVEAPSHYDRTPSARGNDRLAGWPADYDRTHSLDGEVGHATDLCTGKPVRYVLFGHYHPHYTGGLRPVMARGATVVAPPLGASFARAIAARLFRSPPDALAANGRVAAIEPFTGERRFADASNELIAIDIGSDSHHTVEYVVFWLPRQRLLFEGDLGWFGVGAGVRAGGARARGLLRALDHRQLPVATLVQSWPIDGPSTMSIGDFRALLAR